VERTQTGSGKSVLHLVLEYLDCDLFQYINSFSENGDGIPLHIIKVLWLVSLVFLCYAEFH
jgi:hypothetical protein